MNDEFLKQSNLELYELEYSEQHAKKYGYLTGTVNGKTVQYTNLIRLNLAGEHIYPNGYGWPDKKFVGVCVGYPKDYKRYRTPYGKYTDKLIIMN